MSDAIVDSCCVIDLYAAGNLPALLPALGRRLHVPDKVLEETLAVRARDGGTAGGEPMLVQRAVDLAAALTAGLLHRCDLEGKDELELFVRLAAVVDDGEAACLAVAKSRGWTLATDDRKGRREAATLGVPVVTASRRTSRCRSTSGGSTRSARRRTEAEADARLPLAVGQLHPAVVTRVVGVQPLRQHAEEHRHGHERAGLFDQREPFGVVACDRHCG